MKKLSKFKNIHKGKRAFIACNGPSLNDIDVTKLKNDTVFGLNRGYMKKGLDIDYLVVIARPVIEQFSQEILRVPCEALFCNRVTGEHVYSMRWRGDIPFFQTDLTKPMWQGHTVTYVAMQLAYYMGMSPVYCIGMDHEFKYDNTKKNTEGPGLINVGDDLNHFDPNYFGDGTIWLSQDKRHVEIAYRLARKTFNDNGREIYNASTYTILSEDILPRVDFNDISFSEK